MGSTATPHLNLRRHFQPLEVPVHRSPSPLLTVRAAITVLFSFVIGCCAGVLAYIDNDSAAAAVLVGMGVGGGALALLTRIIDDRNGDVGQ